MTKKFLGIFLALMLIFGGAVSAAGEFSLSMNLTSASNFVSETATLRGAFSGFYGEVEVGDKVKIAEDFSICKNIDEDNNKVDDIDGNNIKYKVHSKNKLGTNITGINIGTKLEIKDSLYGIGQVNFGPTSLNSEGKAIPYNADDTEDDGMDFTNDKFIHSYSWGYQAIEVGGGAEIQVFKNIDIGMEATLVNENPLDLDKYSPNFSVFASLDFAAFPKLGVK